MSPLGETVETAEESKHRYKVLAVQTRLALLLSFFMFVIIIVLVVQFAKFNDKVNDVGTQVDQVGIAADKATAASQDSQKQVADVIAQQINSPEAQRQLQLSRQRIINIEYALCKGPCPDAPASSPAVQPNSK